MNLEVTNEGGNMKVDNLLLAGCGILEKEVRFLNEKNHWDLDLLFVDSALHCDFCKLANCLKRTVSNNSERDLIIFYGACHPLMDSMLDNAGTFRTEGQNCVEMLLGKELFTEELLKGAFFLMEDWANRWEYITSKSFPNWKVEVVREIFQTDRKYFLALRTPCSEDFSKKAEETAAAMQVPLRWLDVSLDHLEQVLQQAVDRKRSELNG